MQLNIINLIEKNPIIQLKAKYNNKFIQKIQNELTETQQELFTASFYTYLNYDAEKDFVVNLKDIWNWLGFSRKDPLKRVLLRHFKQNINYVLHLSVEIKSGRKEEQILMNVNTFKRLCSISGTSKAMEIHEYFIKVEKILIEITNEENDELRLQLQTSHQDLQKKEIENQKTKHNILLASLSKRYVVYILKIFTYENDEYIIKIGQTKDINERLIQHNCNYKSIGKPLLLDVFEVLRPDAFENFLLNTSDISKHKTNKLVGFEKCKEHVLIDATFTYQHVLDIIKNNIQTFQYPSVDLIKQEHELYIERESLKIKQQTIELQKQENELKSQEIKIRQEAIKSTMDLFNVSIIDAINIIDKVPQVIPEVVPEMDNNLPLSQESMDSVEISMGIINMASRGLRVQKIDKDTHDIIKTYDCINECLHSEPVSRSRIINAHENRQVYKDFRWNLVTRDLDVNEKYNIGDNVFINTQNVGYIAQLNIEKTIIKNVYKDQKSACIDNNYSSYSSLSKSVKTGNITQNHIYQLYTSLPHDLRMVYENTHGKPFFMENGIEKICIQRNVRISLYKNKSECVKKDKIGNATLVKYINSGNTYNGFIYRNVNV
jgi:hypothetical protein